MKTIALFGGSFDPPHLGHKAVVDAILSTLDVDEVVVMPAYLNPFKSKVYASGSLRFQWLQKIFSSYKNVKIDDFELTCKQKVPTLQTALKRSISSSVLTMSKPLIDGMVMKSCAL